MGFSLLTLFRKGEIVVNRKAYVTKEFTFEAAHQLPGHKSKCANLHGHSYRVVVTIYGDIKDFPGTTDDGMVIDFADLKEIVKPIIDEMDHSILCDEEQYQQLLMLSDDGTWMFVNTKLYNLGMRTTAENIAWHIADKVYPYLSQSKFNYWVEVYETPTSSAKVDSMSVAIRRWEKDVRNQ